MTIDNEKTIVITEKEFKDKAFAATNRLTDKMINEGGPSKGMVMLLVGAMITSEISQELFGDNEDKPESEKAAGTLKFGDEV